MDVVVDHDSITFKMLGGPIDMFILAGPDPLAVLEQYTRLVGRPAWFSPQALGFHQSRYGYRNISMVRAVVERFRDEQLPLDSIWLDIEYGMEACGRDAHHFPSYMKDKRDFTLDPVRFPTQAVEAFAGELQSRGQSIIPILDPGISTNASDLAYQDGIHADIFIRNPQWKKGRHYEGQVWPGRVHYVDFTHANASAYWSRQLERFFACVGGVEAVGGLWLDMNEPSNFVSGYDYDFGDMPMDRNQSSLNFPRYMINNGGDETPVYWRTVPMDTCMTAGTSYELHNAYGLSESIITYNVLRRLAPTRRPFLLTRSTFPGSGAWAATWLGDNFSTFPQLALSVTDILQFQLLGVPFVGADICGFLGDVTEELCARWMALGAFYPFARNHNSIDSRVNQEPFRWPVVADVTRKYFGLRYALLPYWYHLMHRARHHGEPYWRPLFFAYPQERELLEVEDQFLLGESLLVSPVLKEGMTEMAVRIPPGEWYDWDSLAYVKTIGSVMRLLCSTPIDHIPLHVRAGSIIPMQHAALTMRDTRLANMTLLVALNGELEARGHLYMDDGASLDVGERHVAVQLEGRIRDMQLRFAVTGHVHDAVVVPFVTRIRVLTAGHDLCPSIPASSNETFTSLATGFVLDFAVPVKVRQLAQHVVNLCGCQKKNNCL